MTVLGKQVSMALTEPDTVALLAEALDMGCVIVDADLRVRTWNRWMETATGRAAADAVGYSIVLLFPEIAGTASEHALRRAATGESVVFAHGFHGHLLPVKPPASAPRFTHMQQSARIMPFTVNNVVNGAVAFIQDVSERIAREHDLSEAKRKAEMANEARSEFLKGMSHEFRTPLNAILGYAALLDSDIGGSLNEVQRAHLRRLMSGAEHLVAMVEEILTFASVEAQKISIEIVPTDVSQIVAEVVSMLENQARQKSLLLEFDTSPEITIPTDPHRLRQILVNLIGNAIKFTSSGKVQLLVRSEDSDVLFTVCDTGPGIPPGDQDRIFEPFMQVEGTKAQHSGTGLGLPLSRSLAELLGGSLSLADSNEKGSCFVLRLPNSR